MRRRRLLRPVVVLVALAVCGLITVGVIAADIGLPGVLVGTLAALLPVWPLVATFLWIDRWEPEPPRLLQFAFLWGAGLAVLVAGVINTSAGLLFEHVLMGVRNDTEIVIIAPIVEEVLKGALIVGLLVWRFHKFDGIVNGIVYAGLVGTGFAFTENILYLGRAFAEPMMGTPAGQSLLLTFILRAVAAPFAHPLFTAMTGIGAGIAARSRRPVVRVLAVALGLVAAIGLHMLWNGSSVWGGVDAYLLTYAATFPLLLAVFGLVLWQRRRERRTVVDQLPGFAQTGLIAPEEIPMLASLAGRRRWKRAVRRQSGKAAATAMLDYQVAVTALAFLRARIARGTETPESHQQAVDALIQARLAAVGHPEALTVAMRHHGPPNGAPWTPPPPGPPVHPADPTRPWTLPAVPPPPGQPQGR